MTTTGKKRHYVPQFLLYQFACEQDEKDKALSKINVFDKRDRRQFTSTIRDIGQQNHFYDDSTDQHLTELENLCGPAIQRLIRYRTLKDITPEDRHRVALFAATQMVRTPNVRSEVGSLHRDMMAYMDEANVPQGIKDLIGRSLRRVESPGHADLIIDSAPKFARHLLTMQWVMERPPDDCEFFVSDNPITKHNLLDPDSTSKVGLRSEGVSLHLPLCPTLSLWILCPKTAQRMMQKDETIRRFQLLEGVSGIADSIQGGLPVALSREEAKFYNFLHVMYSHRYIYAKTREFADAEHLLAQRPEVGKGTFPPKQTNKQACEKLLKEAMKVLNTRLKPSSADSQIPGDPDSSNRS